jgi:non-lysosomal glucosylceramidase
MSKPNEWPVLTRYDRDHLARIALPLGGIGTGTVSLGGRGDLRDWEIVNRPAKGFTPPNSFFALRAQPEGGEAVTRILEGPLDLAAYEGAFGSTARNHGLPRFRDCAFEAAYPFGQVLLSDPEVPVTVRLQAFNPLIPADPDRSGIPAAILRFVLTNPTNQRVRVSVSGSVQNFIGSDGTADASSGNVNEFRPGTRAAGGGEIAGLFMRSGGVDPQAEAWGTIALATTGTGEVTHRTAWANLTWGDSLLDFWDDFSDDGRLESRDTDGVAAPMASLASALTSEPRRTTSLTFLLTWHFPNRMTWTPARTADGDNAPCCADGACGEASNPNWIGNYYTTQYSDAWDVAQRSAAELPELESQTLSFVQAFCESDLPAVVKEAALYNVSTLRTQTCFRTADGHFYGWEGCGDKRGCCEGSCTHVWNYEQATAFLFGSLARSMRTVEFLHATRDDGHMSFRVVLPLERAAEYGLAAADGQMGCLLKLYRDWQLSGDDELLRALWPRARKALEFCWIEGGWDADRDGVMEACQHNTMDVEYYGPNPQMGTWYLGALRAAEEMARYLGETDFAGTCRDLFERGRNWLDAHLFNGDYYEHEIRPPSGETAIAPGLRHRSMGTRDLSEPDLQLGAGCLVDQLVGQYTAHVCGLGYLLDPGHVQTTLRSLMRYNFKESLHGHFNHLRSFALGEESALLMASYPKGRRPRRPFPYYNEMMTGFEYTAAVHMLYEGQVEDGLKAIAAIRARYDGRKRSPFDEAECGHHYARAMASWAAVLALTGFHYSGVEQALRFAGSQERRRFFWSNGDAWGACEQRPVEAGVEVRLNVLHGTLRLRRLELSGIGGLDLPEPRVMVTGEVAVLVAPGSHATGA